MENKRLLYCVTVNLTVNIYCVNVNLSLIFQMVEI